MLPLYICWKAIRTIWYTSNQKNIKLPSNAVHAIPSTHRAAADLDRNTKEGPRVKRAVLALRGAHLRGADKGGAVCQCTVSSMVSLKLGENFEGWRPGRGQEIGKRKTNHDFHVKNKLIEIVLQCFLIFQ